MYGVQIQIVLKFREKWTAPNGTFKLERGENKQKLAKKWFISNDNISVNNGAISILIRFLESSWRVLSLLMQLIFCYLHSFTVKIHVKVSQLSKNDVFRQNVGKRLIKLNGLWGWLGSESWQVYTRGDAKYCHWDFMYNYWLYT